jgi:hypothetical protein
MIKNGAKCSFSNEIRQIEALHTQIYTPFPQFLWKIKTTSEND